jgi:ABC-type bacteriocin/lantibiotic exporter with double-glycine peptidase domain
VPISSLITIIGIFIAAVFKMIPSINKILAALQNIKYYKQSIDLILDELNASSELNYLTKDTKHDFIFKKKIKIKSLSFKYDKWIMKNLNLEINKGQMIGIVGESGSGKSTLIDLITGIQAPTSGDITIDGVNIWKDINSWQKIVGYVSQDIYLRDASLIENIAFGIDPKDINMNQIKKVLEIAKLKEKIDSMPNGVNSSFGELGVQLSGGQKQRVGIARALYSDPEILIFDESTSSLDSKTEKEFIEAITNLKKLKTIIIVSHKKSSLKSCDFIYELKDRQLLKLN